MIYLIFGALIGTLATYAAASHRLHQMRLGIKGLVAHRDTLIESLTASNEYSARVSRNLAALESQHATVKALAAQAIRESDAWQAAYEALAAMRDAGRPELHLTEILTREEIQALTKPEDSGYEFI